MTDYNKDNKLIADKGFTLIEAMIATLLIGIAIVSLVVSSQAFTRVNSAGINLSTAEFLVEEVRARTAPIDFDNLAAFAGTYSPPEDVQGNQLTAFANFSQQVTVQNVSPSDFTVPQAGSDFARVTVAILLNGGQISSASWIRTR
jgi:prepilin-type N-terminal cleavage/methylation domain-containing protein